MSKMDRLHDRLSAERANREQRDLQEALNSLGHSILIASATLGVLARMLIGTTAYEESAVNGAKEMFARSKEQLPVFKQTLIDENPADLDHVMPYIDQLLAMNDEYDVVAAQVNEKFISLEEIVNMIDPNTISTQIAEQEERAGFDRDQFIAPSKEEAQDENGEVVVEFTEAELDPFDDDDDFDGHFDDEDDFEDFDDDEFDDDE